MNDLREAMLKAGETPKEYYCVSEVSAQFGFSEKQIAKMFARQPDLEKQVIGKREFLRIPITLLERFYRFGKFAVDRPPVERPGVLQKLLQDHAEVPGFVYILYAEEVKRIKIGSSSQPLTRACSIQMVSPCALELFGVIPGGVLLERKLHAHFAHLRCHGEWFTLDAEVCFLMQLAAGSEHSRREAGALLSDTIQ